VKVGYIGLGNMGRPMARNIAAAGHHLAVFNRMPERTTEVAALGAAVAASPREVAAGAEVVCLSVSTPDAVRSVVRRDDGALAGMSAGAVLVDFSTVDPATSREIGAACAARGVAFLDAPVSGGVEGAAAGKLTLMVGGDEAALARARPVLEAVGSRIVHTGPTGSGSTVKLINQMLVGVNLVAVLEAFVAAAVAGVDLPVLYKVLSTSAGSSVMLTRSLPDYVLARNFQPGFALDLLAKDLDLVLRMGQALGATMFTPAVVRQILQTAQTAGLGDRDMAAAVIPMEQLHRVTVGEAE